MVHTGLNYYFLSSKADWWTVAVRVNLLSSESILAQHKITIYRAHMSKNVNDSVLEVQGKCWTIIKKN